MNTPDNLISDYYFVPLGREPGGYHDLIGVPPTASENEVASAEHKYRRDIENNYRRNCNEYRKKKEKKEITKEELDAQVEEWKKEKSKKLAEINKLKGNYNKSIGEKRKHRNLGLKDDSVIWLDMYKPLTDSLESESGYLKEIFFKRRPLPEIDQSLSDIVGSPGSYFQNNFKKRDQIKLTDFRNVLDEINLSFLLEADVLWSKLKYSNLEYWLVEIEKWDKELDLISPRLKSTKVNISNFAEEPDFPTVCNPFTLSIEGLHSEEIEDFSMMPKRKGDKKGIGLAELLAKMLAEESIMDTENPEGAQPGRNKKKRIPFENLFMELFEILSDTKDDI